MSHPIITLFSSHLLWQRQYSRSSSSISSSSSIASTFAASATAVTGGITDVERERDVEATAFAEPAASANRAGAFFVRPEDVTGIRSTAVGVAAGAGAFALDFAGAFARGFAGCLVLGTGWTAVDMSMMKVKVYRIYAHLFLTCSVQRIKLRVRGRRH